MRRAPPWWPQGEEWSPHGPPWRAAPRHFRRRFLLITLGVLCLLLGLGFVIGMNARGGPRPDPGDERRGGPRRPFAFAAFVLVIGGGATALAYRRISRPVSELLGAADRLSHGDYQVKVRPDGPRELRALTHTFNDMAARLADSEAQRRRFLADVTHELRTPLAVLQSGIEAQVDGIHPRDDRHLASLLEETQLLGRLIDDLHTLALADAGRLTLHYEPTSPRALIEDAVASLAALAGRRRITLSADVAGDVPELAADPTRLRQVLANLLSNAVRHSPEGGSVHVAVQSVGGDVRFTVSDSGPGIPPDRLERLFERTAPSADSRGSGLGLSIARDLVQAHGGSIRAANGPAGGAIVSFDIPVGRQP
ncbi:MAG TPA: ATP-binding protein [Acidimicrobiales bacterium]|nr:ATP-binding protein [Acidimicrobiales bacterium]